jgi:hypothetical protein
MLQRSAFATKFTKPNGNRETGARSRVPFGNTSNGAPNAGGVPAVNGTCAIDVPCA